MELEIGTISGREIALNNDAEKPTTLLQSVVSEEEDVQTIELQNSSGVDIQPPDESRVFILNVSDSYKVAICVDDGIEPAADLEPGEQEIYSSLDGERVAKIRLKTDGTIDITSVGEGDINVKNEDGDINVESQGGGIINIKNDGTVVINGGSEQVVKGVEFKGTYDVHQHSTAFGPSGPPLVLLLPANFNDTILV